MMLRLIRVDNENTRAERAQTDKAAPMRDIWVMLNRNLERAYKPHECITIDEQFYPFGVILNSHGVYHLNWLNMA